MNRLQSVQNAAARLVTGTRRSDHVSPVLRQLHWLPVRHAARPLQDGHVRPAVVLLSGVSPLYLADDCRLIVDARERAEHAS